MPFYPGPNAIPGPNLIPGGLFNVSQLSYNHTVEYLTATLTLVPDKKYRIIVQRILDKKFLEWDLPLINVSITYSLSGPNLIRGKLKPESPDMIELDLEPKATYIHVEQDGIIRCSGILQPGEMYEDGSLSFVAEGISGYPHGQPFQGEYAQTDIDPLQIVRVIWNHLLASPRANLGLTIADTNSLQLVGNEFNLGTGAPLPYTLFWWDDVDCGREIDALAKNTPFDYYETSSWNLSKSDVLHRIELAYPRAGKRRFDLAFSTGENIVSIVLLREDPGQYASEVIVRGAGEGIESIRGYAANIIGNRIKQAVTVVDRSIRTVDAATTRAQRELKTRQAFLKIREITILDSHDNASLGDFQAGDDILIEAEVYWFGQFSMWCRIISYEWIPEQRVINIQLENSEVFDYGTHVESES